MDAVETPAFAALFAAEDRHFWFRARNRVLGRIVRKLTTCLPPGYRVLEVGCGTGNVLRVLEDVCHAGEVIGSDLFDVGLRFARQRVFCRLVRADVHDLPFRAPFDLVGMFDVLEHLADDRRALRCLFGALAPGGRLVLTVPAYTALWSYADECAGHYRRYAPAELRRALAETGFRVEYLSPFMMPLAPLMWLGRRLAALRNRFAFRAKASARELALRELQTGTVVNRCLDALLALEAPLLTRGWRLPVGTSLLAVAARPAQTSGAVRAVA
jgi:SAM-dependent methyltransferase